MQLRVHLPFPDRIRRPTHTAMDPQLRLRREARAGALLHHRQLRPLPQEQLLQAPILEHRHLNHQMT